MHRNNAVTLVNAYLDAFYAGNFAAAKALVAEDFAFEGPFVRTASREAFFNSAAPLGQMVQGHRLLRQWADGSEVCSIFDVALSSPLGAATVTMSEWHLVEDGRLRSARVLFDPAPLKSLLPRR